MMNQLPRDHAGALSRVFCGDLLNTCLTVRFPYFCASWSPFRLRSRSVTAKSYIQSNVILGQGAGERAHARIFFFDDLHVFRRVVYVTRVYMVCIKKIKGRLIIRLNLVGLFYLKKKIENN